MIEVVARGISKWERGRCTECKVLILKDNVIYKITGPGGTTQHGQGPGRWVCAVCATKFPMSERMQEMVEAYW